jgi:hypothetical protein
MGRIRTIKPEFFRHEELYRAEIESGLPLRVAFAGLFTVADREGRFKWLPKHLKLDVLPWDNVDFTEVLAVLAGHGFIVRYLVDGKVYGYIPSFKNHQVINNKESKSNIPEPPPVKDASFTRADASRGEGKEGKGKEEEHTRVAKVVCEIFGKEYQHPEERMPAEANWYKDIDYQTDKLLSVRRAEVVINQVRAYLKHCKTNDRKRIGTSHKVADTILSADWIALSAPEPVPKDGPFAEAEYQKKMLTPEAWMDKYKHEIKNNPAFKKHFDL